MKKLLVLMLMLVFSSMSVAAVGGSDIKATILRYEPAPAEQGNTVDVWIQLNNKGTKADSVAIKFVPEYPFSLPRGQKGEIDVGTVSATEDKVVKFSVFIDPNAPNGDSLVTFLYKYSALNEWVQLEEPITLQTQDAVLVIEDYQVNPTPVVPGQIIDVTLNLKNAGRISVKNLDVGVDLTEGIFSTIGTGTKKRVNYIGAGETEELTFQLVSDTSTEVKLYNVPLNLVYQDEKNREYTETAHISLVVNAEPEVSVGVDSTDFEKKTKPGTVSLKIINKGVVDMKYVNVRLVQTDGYEVMSSSNEEYVGNLDSDDFETVDFIIKPLVKDPRLSVQIEFKDPYNVDFKQAYNLPLRILTDKDLGKGSSPVMPIIIGIIVIGGGIYWWRKHKKKR